MEGRTLLDVLRAQHVEAIAAPGAQPPQDGTDEPLFGVEVRFDTEHEGLDRLAQISPKPVLVAH